jgi:hypothetical protein
MPPAPHKTQQKKPEDGTEKRIFRIIISVILSVGKIQQSGHQFHFLYDDAE